MAATSYADALRSTPAEYQSRAVDQGNQNGDVPNNLKAAADLDDAVLEAHDTISADSAMALSIAKAVREDKEAIAAAQAEKRQGTEDREMALRLERRGSIGLATPRNSGQPTCTPNHEADVDDELIRKIGALHNNANEDDHDNPGPRAGSCSSSVDARTVRPALKQRVCAACDDHVPLHGLAICPCSHEYCGGCIERIVVNSLTDEASWPPRCCRQQIPVEEPHIRIFLSEQVEGQYFTKKLEMDTPNRVYCHRAECSRFIPPRRIRNDIGACPTCEAKTCTVCKAAAHEGLDCADDEADQQMLALARQEGWKQCFSCHSMVALIAGCNHISKYRDPFSESHLLAGFGTHDADSFAHRKHAGAVPNSATAVVRGGTRGHVHARRSTQTHTPSIMP
ncbi:hypothetical protein SLS53_006118 [Cytospora paraplurivora]|uniref:IBR domain-containing protein n=1 Tax=Cytospora paraplurivora TaxID=2898453 RepID=A0AAN9YF07_9PEZI